MKMKEKTYELSQHEALCLIAFIRKYKGELPAEIIKLALRIRGELYENMGDDKDG